MRYLVSTILTVGFLSGCVGTPGKMPMFCLFGCKTVTVQRDKPPELPALADYDTIALGKFSGAYADMVLRQVKPTLIRNGRFHVVDAASASHLDKSTVIVKGRTMDESFNVSRSVDEGKCYTLKGSHRCIVYSSYADWRLSLTIDVIEGETGKIIAQRAFSKNTSESHSSEAGYARFDENKGFRELAEGIANEIIPIISPHQVPVDVKLYKDKEFPELEQGVEYAKQGNWRAAIDVFTAALEKSQREGYEIGLQAMAHYNLGVALGYSDADHAAAVQQIALANSLVEDGNNTKEIAKIRQFEKDVAALEAFKEP